MSRKFLGTSENSGRDMGDRGALNFTPWGIRVLKKARVLGEWVPWVLPGIPSWRQYCFSKLDACLLSTVEVCALLFAADLYFRVNF